MIGSAAVSGRAETSASDESPPPGMTWHETFEDVDAFSAAASVGDSLVAGGETVPNDDAGLVVRLDSSGSVRWRQEYRIEPDAFAWDAEGGLLAERTSTDDPGVVHTGPSGTIRWRRSYESGFDAVHAVRYDDESYCLCEVYNGTHHTETTLLAADATDGSVRWGPKEIGGDSWFVARDLCSGPDGGIYIVGRAQGGEATGLVWKVGGDGRTEWRRSVEAAPVSAVSSPDGGVVAVDGDLRRLVSFASDGERQWTRRRAGVDYRYDVSELLVTPDGYAIVGDTFEGRSTSEVVVHRLDADGRIVSRAFFPRGVADMVTAAAAGDDEILVAGLATDRADTTDRDAWLASLDPEAAEIREIPDAEPLPDAGQNTPEYEDVETPDPTYDRTGRRSGTGEDADTGDDSSSDGAPGFGTLAALAGLGGGLAARRTREE